jgi:xylulokinase
VVLAKPPVKDEFIPNAERHAILRQRLKSFRELYQHVRPLFDPARPRLA